VKTSLEVTLRAEDNVVAEEDVVGGDDDGVQLASVPAESPPMRTRRMRRLRFTEGSGRRRPQAAVRSANHGRGDNDTDTEDDGRGDDGRGDVLFLDDFVMKITGRK
jgi:hypothetical protein